jgi:hypothetical protein
MGTLGVGYIGESCWKTLVLLALGCLELILKEGKGSGFIYR